jgi:hypothetical protein
VIVRGKHQIGTIEVIILAELQLCWSNRRLGRFILHAPFSQAEEPHLFYRNNLSRDEPLR